MKRVGKAYGYLWQKDETRSNKKKNKTHEIVLFANRLVSKMNM